MTATLLAESLGAVRLLTLNKPAEAECHWMPACWPPWRPRSRQPMPTTVSP